ncbi:MAG: hypothetical protein WC556_03710 [Candidatus Methanoperedens sp.]
MINRHLIKSHGESSFRPSFKTSVGPQNIVQQFRVVSQSVNPFCLYYKPIQAHELKKYISKIDIPIQIVETSNPLKKFMNTLNMNDRSALEESLTKIKRIPFVGDIELEELETPTIIIRLSEMNRKIEEKIFQIEYNLLKKLKTDIDFLVLPV